MEDRSFGHEGGTIPAENLTNYVADRVKTTGEVFLGLTMGCAQCHDHKYEPIYQKEYYQFLAFLNELEDRGLDGNAGANSAPKMMTSTVLRSDELEGIDAELGSKPIGFPVIVDADNQMVSMYDMLSVDGPLWGHVIADSNAKVRSITSHTLSPTNIPVG